LGAAATRKRRHLINIQGFGGWDSTWHHSPMLERDTQGLTDDQIKANFLGVYDTPRFPDDKAPTFCGRNDQRLGVGLSAFTAQDQNDILIWRGIDSKASHDIGNRYTQCGSLSGYAASYSTLIAKALAMSPDYLRPLHYVQTTGTPVDFRSQVGFVTGAGVPINLPSNTDWIQLSATDPNDPIATQALKTRFGTMFDKLMTPSGMKPASAKKMTDEFGPSYDAAETVRNKNYGTSPAFLQIMESYKQAIIKDVAHVMFNAPGSPFAREGLKDFGTRLPTAAGGVGAFLTTHFGGTLDAIVYPIAVAQYLVTQDLSAVVDCTVRFGDFHNSNHVDFLQVVVATSALRKLLATLRTTPVAAGSSESLLDVTTVVMSTEFDRTVNRYPQDPAGAPGTNHGATVSMILAGYGVNRGKIIGGRGSGPAGTFGGLGAANRFNGPLPIDLTTGLPSGSGTLVDNGTIHPTILKIFGLIQPSQQFIGAQTLNAVIRPGHMG
jgi:hypothetical protein